VSSHENEQTVRAVKRKSKHTAVVPIADNEWLMFRDCPESELTLCVQYEFAREHEQTKKWMKWLAEKLKAKPEFTPKDDLYAEFPGQCLSQYPTCLIHTTTGCLLIACRDFFPHVPWLGIPSPTRSGLAEKLWAANDRLTGEKTSTDGGDPELLIMELRALLQDETLQRGFNYAVAIDWTQSDTRLKERFALWLEGNRPSHPPIAERRGKTSSRDLLKALAAWRLTKVATVARAGRHTEDVLAGEPLYKEPSSWSRQAKLASDFMLEFGL